MGAGASREYSLSQPGGSRLQSAHIRRTGASTPLEQDPRWDTLEQTDDGGLIFTRKAHPNTTTATRVEFVCDESATRTSSRTILLKVLKYDDEQLECEFTLAHPQSSAPLELAALVIATSCDGLQTNIRNKQGHPLQQRGDSSSDSIIYTWRPADTLNLYNGRLFCAMIEKDAASDKPAQVVLGFAFMLETRTRPLAPISTPQLIANLENMALPHDTSPIPSPAARLNHQSFLSPSSGWLSPGIGMGRPPSPLSESTLPPGAASLDRRGSFQSDRSSLYQSVSPAPSSDGEHMHFTSTAQIQTPPVRPPRRVVSGPGRPVSPLLKTSSHPSMPPRSATSPNLAAETGSSVPASTSRVTSPLAQDASTSNTPYSVTSPRSIPQLDEMLEMPDDGPLFRAYCKEMEERAYYLRRSLKQLVKSAEAVHSGMRNLDDAEDAFDRSIAQLSISSPNSINALNDAYWDMARKVQGFARKEAILRLEELVIEPLKRLTVLLKTVEYKRKVFEHDSKSFYEHMNKYLAVKNEQTSYEGRMKAIHADEKVRSKRDRYTLARMDYFNILRDLALFKECATLATLTHYAHSIHDINVACGQDVDAHTPTLLDLNLQIEALSAKIAEQKQTMLLQRRSMESQLSFSARTDTANEQKPLPSRASIDSTQLLTMLANNSNQISASHKRASSALPMASLPEGRVIEGVLSSESPPGPHQSLSAESPVPSRRTSAQASSKLRRKEGFLWASSRPMSHQENPDNVRHWQKYWVVLAGGQLCEYADDRLELNNTPINLRFATVRGARMQDRRFTFEVITPSMRRIFQATSAEESQSWLDTIANVIHSLLDGTSSVRNFVRQPEASRQSSDLGLGIFARQQSGSLAQESNGANGLSKHESASDGMRAVLAKLNRPLQRRSSGKHSKRDSMASIMSNFAANPRRREREPTGPLTTLLEASKSMTSVYDAKSYEQGPEHARSASGPLSQSLPTSRLPTTYGVSPQQSPAAISAELDNGIEAAVNTAFGPLKPIRQSPASKERNARELLKLLEIKDNSYCADCGGEDPRWASWNIGIFICIRCSGIHRSLGSHISKVKSVDLDDWSHEQLRSMCEIGNNLAKTTWEPLHLPVEMRSDENIKQLIHMKYVDRRWQRKQVL